ncbi:MAG: tRNA preQ1(34) S-adenosylmethionine ribosyltransferase-isomerase QueA, partial [Alphaproteobacteria bacterium]|nr:tRNA preQ1(34) S-adenosylmethionine ribosyltransferase-isomerase QueA [Alphaproteobacteria bacterium]
MRVDLFDFELPPELIALRPAEPRDSARMLCVDHGVESAMRDLTIRDLPQLLQPGDVVIVNDTRVIPARLAGVRVRGEHVAKIEATLHKREGEERWRAFLRPAKRVNIGERIRFGDASENTSCLLGHLDAQVIAKGDDGEALLQFELSGTALDEAIASIGHMPLPPYIAGKRAEDLRDASDYQTLFARETGAVAAPTAGLHFTPELVAAIEARGVSLHTVTLHVGAGTFLPVKADDTREHRMHSEYGRINADVAAAINRAHETGARVLAVGT